MTLRTKLLRGLLTVAIVPVLVITALGSRTAYRLDFQASTRALENRATAVEQRLDDYVESHATAIAGLAVRLSGPAGRSLEARQRELTQFHQQYPGLLTALLVDSRGAVQIVSTRVNGAQITTKGVSIVADREYFQAARDAPGPHVSAAFRGRTLGSDPLVAVSNAIQGPGGGFAGVVEGSLDLRRFAQFGRNLEGEGGVLVLDRLNKVTYSSGLPCFQFLDDASASPLMGRAPGAAFETTLLMPGARKRTAFLAASAASRSPYGWQVYVFEPLERLRATMLRRLANSLTGLLAGIAVCLLLAQLMAAGITRPLEALARRVRAMGANGALPPSPPAEAHLMAKAPQEVAELATGFDSMAARLAQTLAQMRALNGELEARVAARTEALERSNAELHSAMTLRAEAEVELLLRDRAMASSGEAIAIVEERAPYRPIVYANAAFERLTGYSVEEVLGQSLTVLAGPATDPDTLLKALRAVDAREAVTVELYCHRKDGSAFWARSTLTPVLDPDGAVTHYVGLMVDLTGHKELERLKNELVSTVSHELRTPLTSLRGFAELMLQRDFPPERVRNFIGIIYRESCPPHQPHQRLSGHSAHGGRPRGNPPRAFQRGGVAAGKCGRAGRGFRPARRLLRGGAPGAGGVRRRRADSPRHRQLGLQCPQVLPRRRRH